MKNYRTVRRSDGEVWEFDRYPEAVAASYLLQGDSDGVQVRVGAVWMRPPDGMMSVGTGFFERMAAFVLSGGGVPFCQFQIQRLARQAAPERVVANRPNHPNRRSY